jgi:ADP-ribose pyrophosphatase YjhB (NUDIX family)
MYCIKCGYKLNKKVKNYNDCKRCGFRQYLNPVPTNSVIIENNKKEILLVKRKFNPKKNYWDLPGGFVMPDENIENSTRREIKEELGITLGKLYYLGSFFDKYLFQKINWDILAFSFFAKMPKQKIKISDDITGYKFFSKKNIPYKKLGFRGLKLAIDKFYELRKLNQL